MQVPNDIKRGEPILASFLNQMLALIKQYRLQSGVGYRVSESSGGTTLIINPGKGGGGGYIPPFWVTASVANSVKITQGEIVFPYNGNVMTVIEDELTVANNDYVWVQYDGTFNWSFGSGSAFPTDKLSVELASVSVDGDGVVTVDRTWEGGNMTLQDRFSVTLDSDSGSAGDSETACSFTYTATTLDGSEIGTGLTPDMSPARIYKWVILEATKGTCYIDSTGAFKLWDCNETQDLTWRQSQVIDCATTFCDQVSACP